MSLAQNSKGKNGSAVRVRPTAKPVKPVKPARRKRPVAKHKPVIREILHAVAREPAPAKEVHAPFPIAPFNPPIFPDRVIDIRDQGAVATPTRSSRSIG